jgi:hypothetical protein
MVPNCRFSTRYSPSSSMRSRHAVMLSLWISKPQQRLDDVHLELLSEPRCVNA